MQIIFLGTTAVHRSLIAAAMYLGSLKDYDFSMLHGFGDMSADLSGHPVYIGEDSDGTRVYTLGAGSEVEITCKSIEQLRGILGYDETELVIKPVVSPGDGIIKLISSFPIAGIEKYLNITLSSIILKRNLDELEQDIIAFKKSLKRERKKREQKAASRN